MLVMALIGLVVALHIATTIGMPPTGNITIIRTGIMIIPLGIMATVIMADGIAGNSDGEMQWKGV